MSTINFDDFVWFIPKPKARLFITIPNPKTLNFNSKLMAQMPAYVAIGSKDHGSVLCIREALPGSDAIKLPKSGNVKNKELLAFLISAGIRIPARFTVRTEDDCWLVTLDEYVTPKVNTDHPPKRPRKNNLNRLLEGEHNG